MADKPRSFGDVLRGLLEDREEFHTKTGNINWMAVAHAMDGVYYETLRKAVAGDRWPNAELMEKAAALVGVQPDVFVEYQLYLAQRQFDVKEVGWDEAMANLRAWAGSGSKKR